MYYEMNLLFNHTNLLNTIKSLKASIKAIKKTIPDDFSSSYKPIITMQTELNCFEIVKKNLISVDDNTSCHVVETTSDLTESSRFTHSLKTGDFLTVSKALRNFMFEGIGLYEVDLSACEPRIAGELAKDDVLLKAYEEGTIYTPHSDSVTRDEFKVALNTWLNGGKDAFGFSKIYKATNEWKYSLLRRTASKITLWDGELLDSTHTYKDVSRYTQGNGAACLREALRWLESQGIVGLPHLHDCIYCAEGQVEKVKQAFCRIIPFKMKVTKL